MPLFSASWLRAPRAQDPPSCLCHVFNKGSCCSSLLMCRSLHSNARSQAITGPPEFGHDSRRKSCSHARWGTGTGSECTETMTPGGMTRRGCVFLSRYTHILYAETLWQSCKKKPSTMLQTSGTHGGPLGGLFAVGTLYTHVYEITYVHVTNTCTALSV